MRKHDSETQFACFVRNLTERPIPLSIPFGTLEGQPKLSAQAIQALRARNRSRYSVVADETEAPTLVVQQQYPTEEEPAQPATPRQKRELL